MLHGAIHIERVGCAAGREDATITVRLFDEALAIDDDIDRKTVLIDTWLHANRQHDQIVLIGVTVVALGIDTVQHRIAVLLVLGDTGHLGLDELDVLVALNVPVEILETIDRADIDIVDRHIGIVAPGIGDIGRLLQRSHATDGCDHANRHTE